MNCSKKRLEEALALLRQARDHVDRYGSLDSEGRTLVAKVIKVLKPCVRVDWRRIRKQWDTELVDKLTVLIVELMDEDQ